MRHIPDADKPTHTDGGHKVAFHAYDGEGIPIVGLYPPVDSDGRSPAEGGCIVEIDGDPYEFRRVDRHSGFEIFGSICEWVSPI